MEKYNRITKIWNNHISSIVKFAVIAILIYKWMSILQGADSYVNVYNLCGLAGIVAAFSNLIMKRDPAEHRGRKEIIILLIFSLLFSLMIGMANYELRWTIGNFEYFILFLASFLLSWNILAALYRFSNSFSKRTDQQKLKHGLLCFIIVFLILVIDYSIYLIFVVYPGKLTTDSLNQLSQALSSITSNAHPYYHTLLLKLIINPGLALFHDINHAVALFNFIQLLFMAAVFAYVITTMYQLGANKLFILAMLVIYAFSPYHIAYSITMWKDILFAGAVTLTITAVYRLMHNAAFKGNKILDTILFAVGSLGFCLWRNNGILAYVLAFLIAVILLQKHLRNIRKYLIISAVILVCSAVLEYPVLNLLHVSQTDKVELFSLPEQQVVRAVMEGNVGEKDYEELNAFINLERAQEVYTPTFSDPVKALIREETGSYFNDNASGFLGLWVRLGVHNPSAYLKAWIDMTKGYWNGGYRYWIWAEGIQENGMGISHETRFSGIEAVYDSWFTTYETDSFYEPFRSIGLHFWICFFAFGVALLRKDRSGMIIILPLFAIVFTLLIGTSVFCEFRYVYSLFTSIPIVLLSIFRKNTQELLK